jgi:hypothetical protein
MQITDDIQTPHPLKAPSSSAVDVSPSPPAISYQYSAQPCTCSAGPLCPPSPAQQQSVCGAAQCCPHQAGIPQMLQKLFESSFHSPKKVINLEFEVQNSMNYYISELCVMKMNLSAFQT